MQNFRANNLDAAIAYSKVGLPVIPLHSIDSGACTCRQDCKSPGKHPRIKDWLNKASINEDIIKRWWFEWPNSNVGIVTGRASNLLVVDVDPRHGGDKSLVALEGEFSPLPATLKCITGGGGAHYYFDLPDAEVKNRVNFRPGLDVRAEGGFIVATPSAHVSGKDYIWSQKFSLDKVAKIPQWLLAEIDRFWLIDWETAGAGDPLFDVATIASIVILDSKQKEEFLCSYFNRPVSKEEAHILRLNSFLCFINYGLFLLKDAKSWTFEDFPKSKEKLPDLKTAILTLVRCLDEEESRSLLGMVLIKEAIDLFQYL